MKKMLLLLICLFFVCGCSNGTIKPGKINCNQMKELMKDDNVKLVDVRNKNEYNEGHLDKAINIPVDKITEELLYIDKKTSIIVYCETGARSSKAFDIIRGAGYKYVYDLGEMKKCQK